MRIDFNSLTPIYIQIAHGIEDDIISGRLCGGGEVYSQLVLARELNVNPATAAKGINLLVQKGILEKQRGLPMCVSAGAREELIKERRETAFLEIAESLIREGEKIGFSTEKIIETIQNISKGGKP